MFISFETVKNNAAIRTYIEKADQSLKALSFTEHSFAHVGLVAENAARILEALGADEKDIENTRIAGYLHDIGNVVNRIDHAQSGAIMAFRLLDNMGADPEQIATIITAIGNHDEHTAFPVNPVAAALILADKTDVRCTRVRNKEIDALDIHDRVNFAVKKSDVLISTENKEVCLDLHIDTSICSVADYFEIFLSRMILCRKAAEKFGLKFALCINKQKLI